MHPGERPAPVGVVDLTGRSAVVTGGASGIGLACVERLAAAGARVTVLDLNSEAADRVAESVGGDSLQADLSDSAVVASLDLSPDILVNNAGFQLVSPVETFPPDRFVTMQRLMVEAPFRLIRAALPGMYERGYGRIINISSAHGLVASPYKVGYVTAKHGLEGLSKVVALEGGPHGVTSNCINPRLRTDSVGREADLGPGEGSRHRRERGDPEGDADSECGEAAGGTTRDRGAGRVSLFTPGVLHQRGLAAH